MDEAPEAMVNQVSARGRASVAERAWGAVNRHPGWTLISLVAFYLAIACAQGARKLLWTDELITLAIARQGSLAGIWRALTAGADPNPPLSHWMVMASTRMLGEGALGVRLPAILCVLLAIVGLWVILRRWVEPGYAAVGVLAFMATRGFDYAYDARSYAMLMGFSMVSLACWLVSCEVRGWRRVAALGGMAAALALGVSSNYYGVLAFFPVAAGEAVRAVRRRGVQPGAWVAMAAGALPLLAFLPLIRRNIAEFGPHAWNRPRAGVIAESYLVLVEGVFWPVLGLGLHAVWRRYRGRPRAVGPDAALQTHEAAALAALLLYPVLGFLVAAGGAGLISARCVAPVCCGFGIAAGLLGRRSFGTSARAGVLLLGGALLWVAARESACGVVLGQQRSAFLALRDAIAARAGGRPIVVADSLFVLPLAHYSGEEVRARIVFPIDFDAIHRFEPDDSGEQNLWAGRNGLFPIQIVPYDGAAFAGGGFVLIARPGGWLAQRLMGDGVALGEAEDDPAWQRLGGVFTPMAHEDTRVFEARGESAARRF